MIWYLRICIRRLPCRCNSRNSLKDRRSHRRNPVDRRTPEIRKARTVLIVQLYDYYRPEEKLRGNFRIRWDRELRILFRSSTPHRQQREEVVDNRGWATPNGNRRKRIGLSDVWIKGKQLIAEITNQLTAEITNQRNILTECAYKTTKKATTDEACYNLICFLHYANIAWLFL